MVDTVENPGVKQVNAENALVIAVSHHAVFGAGEGAGVAFPLLQAVQTVNARLLQGNPSESLLFDVMLMTTDRDQQQQRDRIQTNTRLQGLQIHRFCFSCEDDFIDSLQQNKVHLFLTTDSNEATQAATKGVLSALLDPLSASGPSEQLRVLFCGDAIEPNSGSQQAAQVFWSLLGKMRSRFDLLHSPLNIALLLSHGGIGSCGSALTSLRAKGVSVDEAYCLGGAPRGPMISLIRPHFLLAALEL